MKVNCEVSIRIYFGFGRRFQNQLIVPHGFCKNRVRLVMEAETTEAPRKLA